MQVIEAWQAYQELFELTGISIGKSVCFQVAALLETTVPTDRVSATGDGVVWSPLVVLMWDQGSELDGLGTWLGWTMLDQTWLGQTWRTDLAWRTLLGLIRIYNTK